MLKKVSVRFCLICGWSLNFLLHQAATLYQPHPHLHHIHLEKVKDLSLRGSLGSSSSTRLNQTFPLFMEMGLGQVKKQCVNMVYKGPFTISGWQGLFHIKYRDSPFNRLFLILSRYKAWPVTIRETEAKVLRHYSFDELVIFCTCNYWYRSFTFFLLIYQTAIFWHYQLPTAAISQK